MKASVQIRQQQQQKQQKKRQFEHVSSAQTKGMFLLQAVQRLVEMQN